VLVAFRADASIEIGTGHVMRCLALAEELKYKGHICIFICREQEGNLEDLILRKGFRLHLLDSVQYIERDEHTLNWNDNALWLGVHWRQDAEETKAVLMNQSVDWLVVDHYALDRSWEKMVAGSAQKIMVIDDLADRVHLCQILIDQTFCRSSEDYSALVPEKCEVLCGSQFALLRSEFAEYRDYSLNRRIDASLHQLLITMGGADKDNFTGRVLKALLESNLPMSCRIVIVMGETAPWHQAVKEQAATLPWEAEVVVGINNMAEILAESDLVIGAAGSSSWERCVLGVPTIQLVIANNQQTIAENLSKANAIKLVSSLDELPRYIASYEGWLVGTSINASRVCDGLGVSRVIDGMCVTL